MIIMYYAYHVLYTFDLVPHYCKSNLRGTGHERRQNADLCLDTFAGPFLLNKGNDRIQSSS